MSILKDCICHAFVVDSVNPEAWNIQCLTYWKLDSPFWGPVLVQHLRMKHLNCANEIQAYFAQNVWQSWWCNWEAGAI
jgi:hypothetical protein